MSRSQSSPYIADWPNPDQAARRKSDPSFDEYPPERAHDHCLSPTPVVQISHVEPRDPSAPRRWSVVMADKSRRLVEARGFRVESGAVVFAEPAGSVAAFAAGTWSTIEQDKANA